ncbi:MAG TPA: hypothetical protein VFE14_00565, partial [Micromonosporaceae bacterium]|nr:hypothetical protein [Micromonosporaceae bacterium]
MRRIVVVVTAVFASLIFAAPAAWAGSPHFVEATATADGNTLTVSGKEAGLGNETQVHILVTATALCINNGGHHPKAVNKGSFSAEGDFPVQNGKADFSLTLVATFQPDCSPPMTVSWT